MKLDIGPESTEKLLIFDHKGAEKSVRLVRQLRCSLVRP